MQFSIRDLFWFTLVVWFMVYGWVTSRELRSTREKRDYYHAQFLSATHDLEYLKRYVNIVEPLDDTHDGIKMRENSTLELYPLPLDSSL